MKTMNALKKLVMNRTAYFTIVMMLTLFAAGPSVFAAAPAIVSDAQNLATDALTWILILVPVTAALMVGYHAWMKSMADGDPGSVSERNKKMKSTIIGAIIAEGASGIVTAILAYFS